MKHSGIIPVEIIERRILLVRAQKVMLDSHLAELYGVKTKALLQAIKRNLDRFPDDFMFQLSQEEFRILRSQFVTSSGALHPGARRAHWGGRRYPPFVFTEQGVAMLSSVLKSKRAIQVNIQIMKTFVQLRRMLAGNKELARRLDELEKKYDAQFKVVFDALRQLLAPEPTTKREIGFRVRERAATYHVKRKPVKA